MPGTAEAPVNKAQANPLSHQSRLTRLDGSSRPLLPHPGCLALLPPLNPPVSPCEVA